MNDAGQASVSHTTFTDNRAVGGTAGNFIASNFDYALVSLLTPNPVTATRAAGIPRRRATSR